MNPEPFHHHPGLDLWAGDPVVTRGGGADDLAGGGGDGGDVAVAVLVVVVDVFDVRVVVEVAQLVAVHVERQSRTSHRGL